MRYKTAWILGIFGIGVATLLVVKEHLDLVHGSVADWLIPAFKCFDYPGFLAAPWIASHLPLIIHGDIGPNMTEVYLTDGFYVLISGLEWFAVGAVVSVLSRKWRER
jgi:hypothetical protein